MGMKKPGITTNGSRKIRWKTTDVTMASTSVRLVRSLGSRTHRRIHRVRRFTGQLCHAVDAATEWPRTLWSRGVSDELCPPDDTGRRLAACAYGVSHRGIGFSSICPPFRLARRWKGPLRRSHENPGEIAHRPGRPAALGRGRPRPTGPADLRGAEPAEPGPDRGALESDPALPEHPERRAAPAPDGPHGAGDGHDDGARGLRLRVHEPQLSVGLRRGPIQGAGPLGGRADPGRDRGARRQPDPLPP